MNHKQKRNIYMSDELFFKLKSMAKKQQISIGKTIDILYDQWQFDLAKENKRQVNLVSQLKIVKQQNNQLIDQTEMLIQLANTLGVKFNFQQLINTNINESGMVSEAKQFVKAKRNSEIIKAQAAKNELLNN